MYITYWGERPAGIFEPRNQKPGRNVLKLSSEGAFIFDLFRLSGQSGQMNLRQTFLSLLVLGCEQNTPPFAVGVPTPADPLPDVTFTRLPDVVAPEPPETLFLDAGQPIAEDYPQQEVPDASPAIDAATRASVDANADADADADVPPAEVPRMSFSIVGPDPYGNLASELPAALARWSAATCTELILRPGQHTVSYGDSTNMSAGRIGQTTGSWNAATIRVKHVIVGTLLYTITHEIGHVLGRTNAHAVDGIDAQPVYPDKVVAYITQGSLDLVCRTLDCRCQIPETGIPVRVKIPRVIPPVIIDAGLDAGN